MASGKKNLRATGRAPVLPGDRAAAAGCPRALKPRARKSAALHAEVPHPYCASGPAGPGADQGTRFYRSRPVRRGNTIFAGSRNSPGPGRGNCATPGFIRTDVGMPVADHRIDMCRTGPPCNATAGKAGNDTMDSPALHSVLTGALSPAFPVVKTGAAVRFSLRFYAGMVRRPQAGSTQEHSIQEQESGRKLRACTLPQIRPQTGSCTRAIFPLFFSLNFRRNPGETGWQHTDRTASHTAGFVPCRSGAVLYRVICGLKINVFNRDALTGRIYPRIHGKSLRAYFIIRFGYSGRSDPYPQSPGKPPVSQSLIAALATLLSRC